MNCSRILGLGVKTPLVPLHVWLPRAHAEAPVGGSVLLAGVVLKLATYGFVRLLLSSLPEASAYWSPMVQAIAVVSMIYASLSALRQVDVKALVAVSSVAHMAVVVMGLFANPTVAIEGALLLSVVNGLVSPALFCCVGGVLPSP